MAYDEMLAGRIRAALGPLPGLEEKKMFGGVGFMIMGNMACGVHKNDLIVRVGPARYEESLAKQYVHPFDMTGAPMSGWVLVGPQACAEQKDLEKWIEQGVTFARTLPAKKK